MNPDTQMLAIRTLQTRLAAGEWYDGALDDIEGPKTRRAVTDAKRAMGLRPRPFTGPVTITRLFEPDFPRRSATPVRSDADVAPWFADLRDRKGLHEDDDAAALETYLASDGRYLGDPAVIPWCGEAIDTAMARTLPDEPRPDEWGLARGWLDFGRPVPVETLHAVAVSWRGDPDGWQGHVFLVAGWTATHIVALGGNQSDSVSLSRVPRHKVLGARWPTTYPLPGEATRPGAPADVPVFDDAA